jgi:hypothetical protein
MQFALAVCSFLLFICYSRTADRILIKVLGRSESEVLESAANL